MDTQTAGDRPRPTIEERAARRRELQRIHPDRYTSLISVLRGNRAADRGRLLDDPARWHPIARKLVLLTVVVAVLVAVGYVANEVWRADRIDAWSGPTGTVTSGQRVLGCLPEATTGHEYLPTWIRYGDRVFARRDTVRALRGQGEPGLTGQVETGYSLDRMRILLPVEHPAGEPPTRLLVVISPAPVASLYEWAPECPGA